MSSPDAPEETPAQRAYEIEQRRALNKEVVEENKRRKALSRGRLGAVTLLSGLDSVTGGPSASPVAPDGTTGVGILDGSTSSSKSTKKRVDPNFDNPMNNRGT